MAAPIPAPATDTSTTPETPTVTPASEVDPELRELQEFIVELLFIAKSYGEISFEVLSSDETNLTEPLSRLKELHRDAQNLSVPNTQEAEEVADLLLACTKQYQSRDVMTKPQFISTLDDCTTFIDAFNKLNAAVPPMQ